MEDLPPITDYEQSSFCVEVAKRLNMQRKQGQLCDVTLVAKDGEELKAHRNVLSAASPFFCKLLQSDMKENREGIVRFEEISGSVMEDVLEFIYTGTVKVTQENAKELIAAGNYLLIPGLKTISGRFLEREMSNSNCISTFYFAEKYDCHELISNSRKFIHTNFGSVAEMDEFLNLNAEEVKRWISSNEISVSVEADVFQLIIKWVKHSKSERRVSFEELFRDVRLGSLSRECLIDVVTNELVRDNAGCLRLALDALELDTLGREDDQSLSARNEHETRAIVACGGKYTFCYLPDQGQWKRLADGLSAKTQRTNMIKFRGQLYAFPQFGKAERYDPAFNGWSQTDVSINFAMVTVVGGGIYAVGTCTIDIHTTETIIEKYNMEACVWQTIHSSDKGYRDESCIVAADSHLYVFGGKSPETKEYVTKAERFDTVEKKWEEIADMQQEKGCAFGVATQGKIFIAGRRHRGEMSCEMYNISTNEWQLIGSLNVSRTYGGMVCLNGTLYVLGGTDIFNNRELSVECYNLEEDKWIQKTTIPMDKIVRGNKDTFTGCELKLSKGVLDKCCVVGE